MSCICQYIIRSQSSENNPHQIVSFALPNPNDNETSTSAGPNRIASRAYQGPITDDTKIAGCVSELASCRAENWLLKKKLREYKLTIESLEQVMATIITKQQTIQSDMFEVRKRNLELENECHLEREYHSMERDALIKELRNAKTRIKLHAHALSGEGDHFEEDNQSTDSQEMNINWNTDSGDDDDNDNDQDNDHDNDADDDGDGDGDDDNYSGAMPLVNSSSGSLCSLSSLILSSSTDWDDSDNEGHGTHHGSISELD